MHEIRIPDRVYQQVAEAAAERHVTIDVFVAQAVQIYLADNQPNLDPLFTPEVISELDQIVTEVDTGGRVYTSAQLDAHFEAKRETWIANHPV